MMILTIGCFCALVIPLLYFRWKSKRNKRKKLYAELRTLLIDYIRSVERLAGPLRKSFDNAKREIVLDEDEKKLELLLQKMVECDHLLRQSIQRNRRFLTSKLKKELTTFLSIEGNVRHVSPKDLENFVAHQLPQFLKINDRLKK